MSDREREIPHMERALVSGRVVWRSELTGMTVSERAEGDGYVLAVPEWMARNEETGSMRPLEGRTEFHSDIGRAIEAYAGAWIEYAAVTIGLGFHPDTPAADYEPPLADDLREQYDDMITLAARVLVKKDEYEKGMDGWIRAGYIPSHDDGPVPPAP